MKKREIYFDHAATVPMRREAVEAYAEAALSFPGNPSAQSGSGREAKRALERARAVLASTIGADPSEVYFTSGGTEGDNYCLHGALAASGRGSTCITSAIEHHAVLHCLAGLAAEGYGYCLTEPAANGIVPVEAFLEKCAEAEKAGRKPVLFSLMAANNETGAIQPFEALAGEAKERGILFHTDYVQAYAKVPVDVRRTGIDFLSASAHKIGGPRGTGFVYVRRGTACDSLLRGGMQERGRRPGTEDVASALAFAKAAELAFAERKEALDRTREIADYLRFGITERFPQAVLNGPDDPKLRLPGTVSVSFPQAADLILMSLSLAGIAAGTGSACTAGSAQPSHVILAMTGDEKRARGTLRFTLGPENTKEEADQVLQVLQETLERLGC